MDRVGRRVLDLDSSLQLKSAGSGNHRSGICAAAGNVFLRIVFLGLDQLRCRSLVQPRLSAATALRFFFMIVALAHFQISRRPGLVLAIRRQDLAYR